MAPQPIVSIVTPSFNSAAYIERTIESVLSQDYPRIEHIVMDGASTDGTVAILERYSDQLQFISAPDRGVVDAINKGFAMSKGDILAWLSADDEYLPGAVSTAVRALRDHPDASVVYGGGTWVDAHGTEIGPYPVLAPYRREAMADECGICQPAAFMRREAMEEAGWLDPTLNFAFDYDLWIRLAARHPFVAIPERLALSRMHHENKTLGKRREILRENIAVLRRHYQYVPVKWIYGYLSFLRDGRDQFFEPLRHSPVVYGAALAAGSVYNFRKLWRYWREWASPLAGNLRRAFERVGSASI
jgi:glycosyltransferase involved in cell wall biosynthesis